MITYIGRVGNQFSEEDFFVGVESVDNQTHQLSDFGLEGEGFDFIVRHFRLNLGSNSTRIFSKKLTF